MDKWQLIVSPQKTGAYNMRSDLRYFNDHENGSTSSILRIYSWRPKCISLGYSQKIEEEIDLDRADSMGWDIVKRPTGGGMVFHNEAEITYSLITSIDNPILPKGLVPSCKKISEAVIRGLNQLGIHAQIQASKSKIEDPKPQLCFSYPAEYEVVVGGKKLVGSAQKRGRRTLLQQGSIYIEEIEIAPFAALKKSCEIPKAISVQEILRREIKFEELKEAIIFGFEKEIGACFEVVVELE